MIIESSYNYDETVYYKCDTGYRMTGSGKRTCLASGNWSGVVPVCNGRCKIHRGGDSGTDE